MKEKLLKKLNTFIENKKLFWTVIGTLIFLIVGIIGFIVGAYLTGWNVLEWFISPMAITIYCIVLFLGVPIGITLFILWWCQKDDYKK